MKIINKTDRTINVQGKLILPGQAICIVKAAIEKTEDAAIRDKIKNKTRTIATGR